MNCRYRVSLVIIQETTAFQNVLQGRCIYIYRCLLYELRYLYLILLTQPLRKHNPVATIGHHTRVYINCTTCISFVNCVNFVSRFFISFTCPFITYAYSHTIAPSVTRSLQCANEQHQWYARLKAFTIDFGFKFFGSVSQNDL